MENYEKDVEKNEKRNEKFLKVFEDWLKEKSLSPKTIKNHLSNTDLYINDYLNYYEATEMEEGTFTVDMFLEGWFIRKCAWSSANSIKTTAASIKKFYQCMTEKGFVDRKDYDILCEELKENMDSYIKSYIKYEKSWGDFY